MPERARARRAAWAPGPGVFVLEHILHLFTNKTGTKYILLTFAILFEQDKILFYPVDSFCLGCRTSVFRCAGYHNQSQPISNHDIIYKVATGQEH